MYILHDVSSPYERSHDYHIVKGLLTYHFLGLVLASKYIILHLNISCDVSSFDE